MPAWLVVGCAHSATSGRSDDCFSPDYETARSRVRQAVTNADGRLTSLDLTATGPNGEDLTVDIGWFVAADPKRVIAQEFGTCSNRTVKAMRAENQQHHHGEESVDHPGKVKPRNTFFPPSYAWRKRVLRDGVKPVRTLERFVMLNEAP